jgi:hypothetical protein
MPLLRIVPLIATVQEHLTELVRTPNRYCPERCPHEDCGMKDGMRRNGYYERKPYRGQGYRNTGAQELGPVKVQRCKCLHCRRTCSFLPSCLPAQRWYLWAVQAAVLLQLLAGGSVRACARRHGPDRRTVHRWWRWLQDRHEGFAPHLRRHKPELLGRAADKVPGGNVWKGTDFWQRCLSDEPLAEVMAWLHGRGVRVP